MKLIRWFLGKIILLADALAPAKVTVDRSAADQARVDAEARGLKLYQYAACPFCVKVRRAARSLGLTIEARDARREGPYRDELLAHGGKSQVPCLRITEDGRDTWMYESKAIVAYLHERFGVSPARAA